ncbi:MAG: hypothetical protein Q8R92_05405 [Deltaproteobacteria bacterium]|nr:hypothetical protein [Deltaproteobacteria bacterium]
MPANRLSFALTDSYRERLNSIHGAVAGLARVNWTRLDPADLDGSYFAWRVVTLATLSAAQGQAAVASAGYGSAFLTAELGEQATALKSPLSAYVGRSRDGRTLTDALASPLIAVKAALKQGQGMQRALRAGQNRALRILWLEIDHAATDSLLRSVDADDRFEGWQRAVRGTCGACLGAATGPSGGLLFPKHENCQCVVEPRVRGVRDRFPRPTGAALFAAMSQQEQDAAVGPEAAELVRSGAISLRELIGTSPQAQGDDCITQKTLKALR